MSKSRGNVINPDDVVCAPACCATLPLSAAWLLSCLWSVCGVCVAVCACQSLSGIAKSAPPPPISQHAAYLPACLQVWQYGADSLRLYEMFMGPLRDTKVGAAGCAYVRCRVCAQCPPRV